MQKVIGRNGPLSRLVMHNPMQAELESPRGAEFSEAVGPEAKTLMTATPSLGRNLVDNGGHNGVEDYSMAGDYYLSISLMRQDYTIEFPFTISVEIVGEPAQGPTYADGATWSVTDGASGGEAASPTPAPQKSGGPSDSADPQESAAPDAEDEDGPLGTGVVVGIGAVVVAAIAAGLALLWRRRKGTSSSR